jgi:hypothetical protein
MYNRDWIARRGNAVSRSALRQIDLQMRTHRFRITLQVDNRTSSAWFSMREMADLLVCSRCATFS